MLMADSNRVLWGRKQPLCQLCHNDFPFQYLIKQIVIQLVIQT